jgi:penicillin-insensitive murein endopeptidase
MQFPRLLLALALCAGASAAVAQTVPAKQLFGFVAGPAAMKPRSIGSYAKGCLAGGVALPINGKGYQAMRLSRNRNWGHPALVEFLTAFARELQTEEGWPGLLIGDLSQPRGGPMLTGHKSHQIGLDADIWFRPMPDHTMSHSERESVEPLLMAEERGTTVTRNWSDSFVRILRRAAVKSEVARLFVHPAIKRAVCDAVPEQDRVWLRKLRPIYGHNYHFHVRLDCPAGQAGCVPQKPIPEGDGCGKELDDWIAEVSKPPKPSLLPPVEEKTPDLTMAQLPSDCRRVLEEGRPKEELAAIEAAAVPLPVKRSQVVDHK